MGPRGGVVTQRSAKPCTPVQFWSWPPLDPINALRRAIGRPWKAPQAWSAGGVPTLRKRNQRPGLLVVVGSGWRSIVVHSEGAFLGHRALLGIGGNRRSNGIEQSVEFSFVHRALRGPGAQGVKTVLVPG